MFTAEFSFDFNWILLLNKNIATLTSYFIIWLYKLKYHMSKVMAKIEIIE